MVFSWQKQEKCREKNLPLYIAFTDLRKAFHLVSKDGLFKALKKKAVPQKYTAWLNPSTPTWKGLCSTMKTSLSHSTSATDQWSAVAKQGCVLALTLFGIFYALIWKHAFGTSREGIYLQTRSDSKLFHLAHLKAKSKVRETIIKDMLTLQWQLTNKHSCNHWQTAFFNPAKTLGWPSIRRRPAYSDKTLYHC